METKTANAKIVQHLMFRLLPVQVILFSVSAVNGIVSGIFATNYIGTIAMTAVGLYYPVSTFLGAVAHMFNTGATILCGQYMGMNRTE